VEEVPFDERFLSDPIESGLELILRGLEYLTDNPNPRRRKHAILDLCSGVETLIRERLRQEHWSLVFEDPAGASKQAYDDGTFRAVRLEDALDRLQGVCGLDVPPKWRWGLESLARRRSRLEGRGLVESTPVLMAIAVAVVTPFVDSVPPGRLNGSLAALLDGIRNRLATLEGRINDAARRIAEKRPNEVLLACPNCREEGTLVVEDGPQCLYCGYSGPPEDVAAEYARDLFPGEERAPYRCPVCERNTLLDVGASDEDPWYKCFACGRSWGVDDLAFCSWCGQPFEPPEDDPDEDLCRKCRGEEGEG